MKMGYFYGKLNYQMNYNDELQEEIKDLEKEIKHLKQQE